MNVVMERKRVSEVKKIKKYEIWMATLREGIGSEQQGVRPVVIISNNVGNFHSPTVSVAPLTSSMTKTKIPTHVAVSSKIGGLDRNSVVLLEQVLTLDKSRLKYKICDLDSRERSNVDVALMISFGLQPA